MKRGLLAAAGIAAIGYAGLLLTSVPAGYISPYVQATLIWVTLGTYALLVVGLFTLVAAVMQRLGRATAGAVFCLVFGLTLWFVDSCPRMDWCAATAQQIGVPIDDGQGG